ncbi:unnamed protein product [Cyclocybe aegerita]|uniref:Pali-domain-containing protein n=1 Tax=Cyclocybe aegerita TaxID=1973307 RepID=A0A8S0VW78_CYCAE|nr:unnamed protein product [Cyclocybe aegerita]
MGCLRPATPGFIVTLVATILLAVVSFCVPYFKSIYFLKANITVENYNGSITFGTLGYCLQLPTGTTCSKPSVGYELDINGLIGNDSRIQIPQVAVKWITYALVLHIVALVGAAGSAVFGLLAHVREMSMACCSTFVSGFAAVIAMLAFIFDMVLFFVAKARINAVGSAEIGNAIWLTLAAWLLLFFSGCFYTLGRCCISKRPSGGGKRQDEGGIPWGNKDVETGPNKDYAEQMRLDAVKAEADRKARQKQGEGGLPAFYESQPLTAHVDGDRVLLEGDHNESQVNLAGTSAPPARHTGYVPAAPGTRATDDYYSPQPQTPGNNSYPPQQNLSRQRSEYSTYTANVPHSPSPQNSLPTQGTAYSAAGGYGQPSNYPYNVPMTTSPPPSNQMLAPPGQYTSDQYGRDYGHTSGGTSYHSASSHVQQPSSYSQYDPYGSQPQPQPQYAEPAYNSDPYNNTPTSPPMPQASTYAASNPYYGASSSPPPQQGRGQPERSYTLGGDGYGMNSVPPLPEHSTPGGAYYAYGGDQQPQHINPYAPSPIDTNTGYAAQPVHTSPVKGPRAQPGAIPEDSPPGYEPGTSGITGNWGKR